MNTIPYGVEFFINSIHKTLFPSIGDGRKATKWSGFIKLNQQIYKWTPTHGHISICWPVKTYIHHLCADTGCRLDDLLKVMAVGDGWRERVKRICIVSMPSRKSSSSGDDISIVQNHSKSISVIFDPNRYYLYELEWTWE